MKIPNIRFNLKFFDDQGGEIAIRTIEDLKNNLNVSDLYAYMMDGTLTRWLRSLHETELVERVESIKAQEDIQRKVMSLLKAFDIEATQSDLDTIVTLLCRRNSSNLSDSQCKNSDVKHEEARIQFVDKLVEAIEVFKTKGETELRSSISSLFQNYEEKMVDLLRTYNPTTCRVEVGGADQHGLNTLFLRVDFMSLVMLIAWTNPQFRSRVDHWYVIRFEAPGNCRELRPFVHRFKRNEFTGFSTAGEGIEVNYVTNWLRENHIPMIGWMGNWFELFDNATKDPASKDLESVIREHFAWTSL